MSYHLNTIPKGTLGSLDKVMEELLETLDAEQQGCKIMILLELSDMIGAIEQYLIHNHKETTITDLIIMKDITKRAFESGSRI